MSGDPSFVEVDGNRFSFRAGGPGEGFFVHTQAGESVRLSPWGFDDHLAALDRHVHVDERGLRFDQEGFSREVLGRSGVPAPLFDELGPLSLWWAAGGAAERRAGDGWMEVGSVHVRLRPWTWAERNEAVRASTTRRPDGAQEFSLEKYLRAMVAASIAAVDPPGADIRAVPGAAAALIDAVVAINVAGDRPEDRILGGGGEAGLALSATTLRLCKALGWTPSQVWSAPAAEIDRLLAMLDAVEVREVRAAPAPRPAPRSGLAGHPDATVILVEDG